MEKDLEKVKGQQQQLQDKGLEVRPCVNTTSCKQHAVCIILAHTHALSLCLSLSLSHTHTQLTQQYKEVLWKKQSVVLHPLQKSIGPTREVNQYTRCILHSTCIHSHDLFIHSLRREQTARDPSISHLWLNWLL